MRIARHALGALLLSWAGAASAGPLVYRPVNPQFGGDPFNGSQLMATATAQNKYKEKVERGGEQDQAQIFVSQLQSRLLSALANQVTDAIFGENAQNSGTFAFGDQSVSFVRTLDSVLLTIINTTTGAVTKVTLPTYVKPN